MNLLAAFLTFFDLKMKHSLLHTQIRKQLTEVMERFFCPTSAVTRDNINLTAMREYFIQPYSTREVFFDNIKHFRIKLRKKEGQLERESEGQ